MKPATTLPGFMPGWVPALVMGKVMRLVTPRRVKSPVTSSLPLATSFTEVLLKVMVGYFSTSKKSAPFRCLSRPSLSVFTLAASMLTSTLDLLTSAGSTLMVPLNLVKRPLVLASRWRILKLTSLWTASIL